MKLGLFGGTFDPPHIGHVILAAECCHQLALDEVDWILTPRPPHKPERDITPVKIREKMLHLIVDANPQFDLSRVDIDRPPPHYAADTVEIFRENHPGDDLIYLIGEDSLRDLPSWERPQELIERVDGLGVYARPGVDPDLVEIEDQIAGLSEKLIKIAGPLIQISSSEIRSRIREGKPYRYFIPPLVYSLIEEKHLYKK
ncbi:MAG: nicotinate-nucleotide adenylyltransferase [Anaerolineales bacterium]